MRNKKFFDAAHAAQQLRDCVIMLGDDPIYVYNVHRAPRGDGINISYCPINRIGGAVQNISVRDPAINMEPVPLGMCSFYDGDAWNTFYVGRYPARKWKVGLSRENISVQSIAGRGAVRGEIKDQIFPNESLDRCIRGTYDTLDKAMAILKEYAGVLPFSRRFAITHTGNIYYKLIGKKVGKVQGKHPVLLPEYGYLQEVLAEDLAA